MTTIIFGILEEGLVYAIMALGVYITYKILDFPDLSVDGTFPLGAAVTAAGIANGLPFIGTISPVAALFISFTVGALAGCITGLIHVKLKVRDLLSGIIVMTALYSINLRIAGKANLPIFSKETIFSNSFLSAHVPEAASPFIVTIILFVIVMICKVLLDAYLQTRSGYLLRLDHQHADEEALNSFTTYTYKTPFQLQIEYPGSRNRDDRLTEEIRQDFSDFEKTLYSYDYDREKHGYTSMIDVDSFVDYFIINELSSNADAGNYSTYIYKGTDNLYHMCVWDFNNACNNYFEEELPYTGFFLNNRLWFEMLIKDEDFTERVIQRYHSLRKGLLSEESLYRYIDETLDFIAPALERNDARWGSVEQQAKGLLVPVSRNLDSRSAAEGQLKGYLRNRGEWLDENIETLRQYSASSRVKQYNEVND